MNKPILVLTCLLLAIPCQARIITVDNDGPADFNNIQAGIDDANNGDTIEVQPGRYTGLSNRDIDFKGKSITVRSIDPNDPDIVAATVIDGEMGFNQCLWCCNGCVGCERYRGFAFRSGEGPNSVLAGLTITRFCAPDKLIWGDLMPVGGGILCEGSSPTIRQCIIIDNTAHILGRGGFGGGIYSDETSNPTITSCTVSTNNSYFGAGGIECTRAAIADCTVIDNSASFGAGGISCEIAVISCCTVINNRSFGAGGIYCNRGTKIDDCVVSNNVGGGICGRGAISYCTITGNSVFPGQGGGIFCGSGAKIEHCIIASNSAVSGEFAGGWVDGEGGGIYCTDANVLVINSIIVGNWADANGGGIYGNPTITNCIIWNNNCPNEPQISGMPNISYSDIQDGWLGIGNINVDPNFADVSSGDYHLKSQAGRWDPLKAGWIRDDVTSLCIDAGDPASPVGYEPFPNGGIINMGAYGGTAEASKSYFGEPICETIVAGDINGDCKVDFKDFAFMAFHWLEDNNP
jgi:parallel beta-helix repeat protein